MLTVIDKLGAPVEAKEPAVLLDFSVGELMLLNVRVPQVERLSVPSRSPGKISQCGTCPAWKDSQRTQQNRQ